MSRDVIDDADRRMGKSIDSLRAELARVRTGRAHPALLESVQVNYYGSDVPLNQAANIHAADARTLSISPWDKSMIPAIEKAILHADLGFNPVTSGESIRIPLPPLTEERRKALTRIVRAEAEKARVAIRNIRRDANSHLKEEIKAKRMTEDDARRNEEQIQAITDARIKAVEQILADKEKELMEI